MKTYTRNCSALCEETESALAGHPCASQADAVATWPVILGVGTAFLALLLCLEPQASSMIIFEVLWFSSS